MTQRDVMFLVGGSLLVWFFMRNRAAASAQVVDPGQQSDMGQGGQQGMPVLVNQQPYYNITFSNNGNMFNPLATEYMPLFGFIATRSYF